MTGTTNIPGVCLVIRDGSKILLVLRENTGWKDGDYALPGGHVDPGENFRQAAVREAQEETGIRINPADLKYLLTVHRKSIDSFRIDVYFEVKKWKGTPTNTEPEIHGEIAWFDIADLPANLADYMDSGLKDIGHGESYAEHGWD